jgi:DNA (cytosine-5)-methyltransferase 1
VIDAKHFLPQSRPRLFIIGIHADLPLADGVASQEPSELWHPRALRTAYAALPPKSRERWLWWSLPTPPKRRKRFADLIERNPKGVAWHTPAQTEALLAMMSDGNRAKVEAAKQSGRRMVGGVYRRTRHDSEGCKTQRAEVRFDDIAGCLRTPAGGSSRQTIILVDGPEVRTRLLSPREASRLMGLADKYKLPDNYNEAYHLIGDGLAVPVVRFLAAHILEPALAAFAQAAESKAA